MKREEMHSELTKMDRAGLIALQAAIAERLAALDAEPRPALKQLERGGSGSETSHPKGSIEYKMIGKCGPYAYLRYWEGGHLRSRYLGRADKVIAKAIAGS